MSTFAALMALSASQTAESEAAVQSQLLERQKKEAAKRKAQEEKEAKEREIERKLRLKHLEDQKREEERRKRLEAERRRKEEERERREGEQRDSLRYGPKKSASGYPTSSSASREEMKRRRAGGSDDEDDSGGGAALTREEKRQLRLARELNFGMSSGRKSMGAAYKKAGRRLPGGAVDAMSSGSPSSTSGAYRSVRDRLAHEPPALIKLNVNKRDTRTIDEILQDRKQAKAAKTLSGEDAKGFDNWFGKPKATTDSTKADSTREPSRASSMFSSRSNSPERKPSQDVLPRPTKAHSSTPPVNTKPAHSKPLSTSALSSSVSRLHVSAPPPFKGTGVQVSSNRNGKPIDKSLTTNGSSSKPYPSKKNSHSDKVPPSRPSLSSNRSSSKFPPSGLRKRQRSDSLSDSPPPPKRRLQTTAPTAANSISAEIWKMFGKDRSAYVARDVFSDDEDMEAGADEVEKEEKYSMKAARKEDELAAEEERRREEEKRRKRKEKEMRDKRGY
ncbi:hypothetical protein BC835DRAFT_1363674 [Cytidiella melzeri]|nr:hypothetical protein BC835DRAFT_1363674 [Cytidiella melzeri]